MTERKVFIIDMREVGGRLSATEENTASGGTRENTERGRRGWGQGTAIMVVRRKV